MKLSIFAASLAASCSTALSIPKRDAQSDLRTIQLSPTDIRQVTDDQKFELLAVSQAFVFSKAQPSDI